MIRNEPETARKNGVPEPIARALRRIIRRARMIIIAKGLLAVAATAIAALLLAIAVDASLILYSQTARWTVSALAALVTVVSGLWFLVRPLSRSFTMTGAARLIEIQHPEMQERISSAVQLLTSRDSREVLGSEAMIEALTNHAIEDAKVLSPRASLNLKGARPFVATLLVLVLILAVLYSVRPAQISFLVRRAIDPGANLPNVHADDLSVNPGDIVIADGGNVQIVADVTNADVTRATLRRQGRSSDRDIVQEMNIVPVQAGRSRRFAISFAGIREGFSYRVQAGDALSRYFTVRVMPPPYIRGVDLVYAFPSYTGLPARTERDTGSGIRVLAGSRVSIVAKLSKPVNSAVLSLDTAKNSTIEGVVACTADGRNTCSFTMDVTPGLAGTWAIKVKDANKLTNPRFERNVQALSDQPPAIKVLRLAQLQINLKPDDRIRVPFSVTDDIGVSGIQLLRSVDGRSLPPVSFELPRNGDKPVLQFEGETTVSLADPEFRKAHTVTFQFRAADNLPEQLGGPQTVLSPLFTISIDSAASTYESQAAINESRLIKESLGEITKTLEAAKAAAAGLTNSLAASQEMTEKAIKEADEARAKTVEAERKAAELAGMIEDTYFGSIARRLNKLAGGGLKKVEEQLDKTKLADAAEERRKSAKSAEAELKQAVVAVNEMTRDLEAMAKAVKDAMDIRDLADRQRELALRKQQNEADGNEDKQQAEKWREEQERLAEEIAGKVKESPEALAAMKAAAQAQAARAAAEAERLAKAQESLAGKADKPLDESEAEAARKEMAGKQAALAKEAAALAAELNREKLEAGKTASDKAAAGARSAAKDVEKNKLNEAATESADAAKELANAARQLEKQAVEAEQSETQMKKNEPAEKAAQFAKKAGELAAGQKKLAEAMKDMAGAGGEKATPEERAAAEKSRAGLSEKQAELAKEAAALAAELNREKMEAGKAADKAAASAGTAAVDAEKNKMDEAAEKAGEAAERMADAAKQAEKQASASAQAAARAAAQRREKAAKALPLAKKAGALAGEQKKMADMIKAMAEGGESKAMEEEQAQAVEDMERLANELESMDEEAGALRSDQQKQIANAAEAVAKAKQAAASAAKQMAANKDGKPSGGKSPDDRNKGEGADGKPEESKGGQAGEKPGSGKSEAGKSQKNSAENLKKASDMLSGLAKSMAAENQEGSSGRQQGGGKPDEMAGNMASAARQARNAAEKESGMDAMESAQSLARAAAEAEGKAGKAGAELGKGSSQQDKNGRGQKEGKGGGSLSEKKLGADDIRSMLLNKDFRNWAKMHGVLEDDVMQGRLPEGPEEYRPLIKRYFQEILSAGGEKQ